MMRLTRQYVGGVCAGFGVGVVTGSWLSLGWHPFVVIPGFFLATVGGFLARAAQRTEEKRPEDPPPESWD
jgi:hypothetical protein